MGTRSLTVLHTEGKDSHEICVMYRQFDGYPSGHGQELADFLTGMALVNGIGSNMPPKFANGMGCLAAQVVEHFKRKSVQGGIYLHPAGTRDCWDEFIYHVYESQGAVMLGAQTSSGHAIYDGPPEGFAAATLEYEDE